MQKKRNQPLALFPAHAYDRRHRRFFLPLVFMKSLPPTKKKNSQIITEQPALESSTISQVASSVGEAVVGISNLPQTETIFG